MDMDLRLPMGLLFAILGAILMFHGAVSSPALYTQSLGINVDLIWGGVLLAFGLLMLALAWKGRQAAKK